MAPERSAGDEELGAVRASESPVGATKWKRKNDGGCVRVVSAGELRLPRDSCSTLRAALGAEEL